MEATIRANRGTRASHKKERRMDRMDEKIYTGKLLKYAEEGCRQSGRLRKMEKIVLSPFSYMDIGKWKDVKINMPPVVDRFIKKIPFHPYLVVDRTISEVSVLTVPQHWRRGLIIDRKIITQNYLIGKEMSLLGETVTSDVSIQIKINLVTKRRGIIINYTNIRRASDAEADYVIKIGTPKPGEVPIPGTNKFIAFLPIRKRAEKISA